jgi:phosphatidylglycerophosphate synthase
VSATTVPPTSATPSNWNIANGLTALRIALVPLFAALLLHEGGRQTEWRVAAAVAFAGAVATDRIDGELARSRGLVTNLGKIADPIADKALIGAALISLSILGELWWAVTVIILVRELGITLLRFIVIRHGVMPAGRGDHALHRAAARSGAAAGPGDHGGGGAAHRGHRARLPGAGVPDAGRQRAHPAEAGGPAAAPEGGGRGPFGCGPPFGGGSAFRGGPLRGGPAFRGGPAGR